MWEALLLLRRDGRERKMKETWAWVRERNHPAWEADEREQQLLYDLEVKR